MSLSEYTLVEIDDTLKVVNAAIFRAIDGTTSVQSSITRADGRTEEQVGVVLVVYMTKDHLNFVIHAKIEKTLQHGLEVSDVYLEEVCGDLGRQWLFNSGANEQYDELYAQMVTYVKSQPTGDSFLHLTNVCDVIAEFMLDQKNDSEGNLSDAEAFPFAGWLSKHQPEFYQTIQDKHLNYGALQVALYGKETGSPF